MDLARWSRMPCDAEIFGLFSNLITNEATDEGGELEGEHQRQGKVPDLRVKLPVHYNGLGEEGGMGTADTLCELKILNAGVSRYPRGGIQGGRRQ